MEQRYIPFNQIETRNTEGGNPVIEGYFARFGDVYQLFEGATESIARGAFDGCLDGDIRALYNHNADLVLARTTAGTMQVRQDENGLWGRIEIDPDDTDAMNVYRRIARGSITGCSFGFNIEEEERSVNADGTVHWTITKVDPLIEISPCVFPAYQGTSVSARQAEFDSVSKEIRQRKSDAWKERMKERLKHGTEGTDAQKEN